MGDGLRKGRGSGQHCGRRWRTREGEIFDPVELKAASRPSPLELLRERVGEEPETDSESVTFWRTPRTPEQSAATCIDQ